LVWVLAALASLAVLAVVAWFATGGLRADKAASLDRESAAALERNDLPAAHQKAERASALEPNDRRKLRLASLLYLQKQYEEAASAFTSLAETKDSPMRQGALLGQAAAAGRAGNLKLYDQARDALGAPDGTGSDRATRIGLAHAAVDAADLDTAKRLFKDEPAATKTAAYAKAAGLLLDSPDQAREALEAAGSGFSKPEHAEPAYQRVLRELVFIEPEAGTKLAEAAPKIAATSGLPSQRVLLAQALYEIKEYRAAERQAREAVAAAPEYRDGWNTLATTQLALGSTKDAARSLDIALEFDKSFAYTWYLKSQLAKAEDDPGKAKEFQERAEELGYKF